MINVGLITRKRLAPSDVDDTAVNGATTVPPSSNWAYDHAANDAAHAGIHLQEALTTDHTYSGITCDGVAGYGAAFGECVYLAHGDDKWEKAKADTETTTGGNHLLGIVVSTSITEDASGIILLRGYVRDVSAFEFANAGKPLYLSAATAGAITATAPTGTTGFIVRIVGHAGDDKETIYFNPDGTYVEIA